MVDSSKIEYVQSGQLIAATYVKNSKAIGFLWGVFSICYAIITLVVFIQPHWIGNHSVQGGYLGLWRHCTFSVITDSALARDAVCIGRLDDLGSIVNPALRAAIGFIGAAMLISALSVFALILFICTPTTVAYHVVAWMQTVAAVSTGVGLIVFPIAWDSGDIRSICGNSADRFNLGSCSIRWAYILAIIAAMDGAVLAILGFVLGSKHVKLIEDVNSSPKKHLISSYPRRLLYPSESDPTPSVMSYASTKRSMNLQPILLIPPDQDGYSDFSRSKGSLYRADYSSPSQHFQL